MSHLPLPTSLGQLSREHPHEAHLALTPPNKRNDEQRLISYPVTYPEDRWEVQNVPWKVGLNSLPPSFSMKKSRGDKHI